MKIKEFESLRGLMALVVVIHHWLSFMGISKGDLSKPLQLLTHGGYAVEIFIILSGFVIFYTLDNRSSTYLAFIRQRFFRLFPLYLFCLIISVFLIDFSIEVLNSFPWESMDNSDRLEKFNALQDAFYVYFISHILMLHGLLDSYFAWSSFVFLSPMWSLSLEWQFYLLAPMLFYFFTKATTVAFAAIITSILIGMAFNFGGKAWFFSYFSQFFVGMFSFFIWKYRLYIYNHQHINGKFILPFILGFIWLSTMHVPYAVWFIVLSAVLYNYSSDEEGYVETLISKALSLSFLLKLGEISYSVYLTHVLIAYPLFYILLSLGLDQNELVIFSLPLFVLLTVGVSYFTHRYIELPFCRLGRMKR